MIDEKDTKLCREEYRKIIHRNFSRDDVKLFESHDVALHYRSLRKNESGVYRNMHKKQRGEIADQVFDAVNRMPCRIISCTIDLLNHGRYPNPIPPRYYSLVLLLERFQYFLENVDSTGIVVYESFSSRIQRKMQRGYRIFGEVYNLPDPSGLDRIYSNIRFVKKQQEPLLQFADFVADAIWIKSESLGKKTARYDSIKHNYYMFDSTNRKKRGNCEV